MNTSIERIKKWRSEVLPSELFYFGDDETLPMMALDTSIFLRHHSRSRGKYWYVDLNSGRLCWMHNIQVYVYVD